MWRADFRECFANYRIERISILGISPSFVHIYTVKSTDEEGKVRIRKEIQKLIDCKSNERCEIPLVSC